MLFSQVVHKLGGFNRVMNQNQWKVVSNKMQLQSLGSQGPTLIKSAYKRYGLCWKVLKVPYY